MVLAYYIFIALIIYIFNIKKYKCLRVILGFNLQVIKNFLTKNCKKIVDIILTISVISTILITSIIRLAPNYKNLKIYFVDVGQGDCTVITTPKRKKYNN